MALSHPPQLLAGLLLREPVTLPLIAQLVRLPARMLGLPHAPTALILTMLRSLGARLKIPR